MIPSTKFVDKKSQLTR